MKVFRPLFAILLLLAAAPLARAQINPPVIAKPLKDRTVSVGTKSNVFNLKKTFALDGVSGQVVRFSTNLGDMDVELFADDAPATVANFLKYATRATIDASGNYVGNYDNSLIHRSVPGFVVQGGNFQLLDNKLQPIATDPPVVNEFKVSNTRGTIAMAKVDGDPNSATSQWFFNEADNSANLDTANGGFTVFGRVIGTSISVLDQIAAVPVPNPNPLTSLSPVLSSAPLLDYAMGSPVTVTQLVIIKQIAPIALTPKVQGDKALLKLKVNGNTNPGLVTATINASQLTLKYKRGVTGSAIISILAKDSAKNKVTANFTVTVQ